MTVKELTEKNIFKTINLSKNLDRTISKPYCCDLLSIVMGRAPADCAWVTIMGNINTLAVATLTDAACVILADNTQLDDAAIDKLAGQDITILSSELPIFDTALQIYNLINE